jgi:hypothetical protein
MGPLFSVAFVAILGAGLFALCLVCARIFFPLRRALVLAALSTTGAGAGVLTFGGVAALFLASAHRFESSSQVIAFLLWLALGAVVGGGVAVLAYTRASRVKGEHAF